MFVCRIGVGALWVQMLSGDNPFYHENPEQVALKVQKKKLVFCKHLSGPCVALLKGARVCLCICLNFCVCTCICAVVFIHEYVYVYRHTHTHTHKEARLLETPLWSLCRFAQRCAYVCVYKCLNVRVCACIYVRICIYTSIHIHLYTHTHTKKLVSSKHLSGSCVALLKGVCVCVCVYLSECSCGYMYICTYINTYKYICAHTHIHKQKLVFSKQLSGPCVAWLPGVCICVCICV